MARKAKKITIPQSGAEAYAAGFTAADCPYDEEHPEFDRWNEEWDEAADAAGNGGEPANTESGTDEDEAEDRSVVKSEYRARYAEMGHPSHCGDELANLLNNLCLTKAGIDMPRFEAICMANGVDLSKYNRTTNGWQGRLRMTGRNMLAGKVFAAGGVVRTINAQGIPLEGAEPEYKLSEEWMTSRRKVKAAA